jgi:hypothetical protein
LGEKFYFTKAVGEFAADVDLLIIPAAMPGNQ